MKACFQAFRFVFLAISSITGCIPVPYVTNNIDTSSDEFEFIELNSGTRADVICEFGIPVRYTELSISYKVCKIYGVGMVILSYPAPSGFSLYEKDGANCKEWIKCCFAAKVDPGFALNFDPSI